METEKQILLPALVERAHRAMKRCEFGQQERIEGMLELAATLGAARAQFPSNNAFGEWLMANGLEIDPNAQANLIVMAGDLVQARQILEGVASNSIRYASEEVAKQIRSSYVARTVLSEQPTAQIVDFPVKKPVETSSAPAATSQTEAPDLKRSYARVSDRMDEIIGMFEQRASKTLLRKAFATSRGRELAVILARSIDEGFLVRNSIAVTRVVGLRAVFPFCVGTGLGYSQPSVFANSFDLSKPADRKRFETDVWPAVMANKEKFMADQTRLEHFVDAFRHARDRENYQRVKAGKVELAVRTLPTSERPVVMFGEHLWPRVDEKYGIYNYAELKTAIAVFRDLWRVLWRESPKSRGIVIRQSVRWYTEHADLTGLELGHTLRIVWNLVHVLTRLGETNPEGEEKL